MILLGGVIYPALQAAASTAAPGDAIFMVGSDTEYEGIQSSTPDITIVGVRPAAWFVSEDGAPRIVAMQDEINALVEKHCPLPGSICEECFDAPAMHVQEAPWGGEMGICGLCKNKEVSDG